MVTWRFVECRDETGTVIATTPKFTFMLDKPTTLTAYYEEVPVTYYTLTIPSVVGGATDPAPGLYPYEEGSVVSVEAIPDSGYKFSHWMLDGVNVGTVVPYLVTMDADHTLWPVFTEIPPTEYTLTIQATLGGSTDPIPGVYTHVEGTTVDVTANPDPDYYFSHWLLNGEERTENPIHVLMDRNYTLQAVFSPREVPPPDEIAKAVAIGLGVADAVLIAYYIVTLLFG